MNTRVLELLPGEVYQITLPLPFELEQVNVHLIRLPGDGGGWMMVDSGFGNTNSFELLEASLEELSVEWPQIRQLLLTHLHPDHIGLAERICRLAKPMLLMHEAEAAHLNEMVDAGRPAWFDPMHTFGGTPPDEFHAIDQEFEPMRRKLRRVVPDVPLRGGEVLPAAFDERLEVIWTPGHSVGHVCLYSPKKKWLFSADTILQDITPNIAWLPDRDTLGDYLASLAKLAHYDVEQVLPSHGMPFTGHREWVAQTTTHHEERCKQILAGCASEYRTAHELIAAVWDREFSKFHYHFAIGEVLAHLAYLERQGRVTRRMSTDGAAQWRVLGNN